MARACRRNTAPRRWRLPRCHFEADKIKYAQDLVSRAEAQHKVLQLQFGRLDSVAKSKPGLVAQQEVDDSEGKALASAAQVDAAKSNLQSAESQLQDAQA